jgi:hypothetical protein
VTAIEWLLWVLTVWAVFLLFALFDAPILLERAANRLRRQHLPHWARHGHVPPTGEPAQHHGRHAKFPRS